MKRKHQKCDLSFCESAKLEPIPSERFRHGNCGKNIKNYNLVQQRHQFRIFAQTHLYLLGCRCYCCQILNFESNDLDPYTEQSSIRARTRIRAYHNASISIYEFTPYPSCCYYIATITSLTNNIDASNLLAIT